METNFTNRQEEARRSSNGLMDWWIHGLRWSRVRCRSHCLSTISGVFQVRGNCDLQVVFGDELSVLNLFQVRFKLFQVHGGSGLGRGNYVAHYEQNAVDC